MSCTLWSLKSSGAAHSDLADKETEKIVLSRCHIILLMLVLSKHVTSSSRLALAASPVGTTAKALSNLSGGFQRGALKLTERASRSTLAQSPA